MLGCRFTVLDARHFDSSKTTSAIVYNSICFLFLTVPRVAQSYLCYCLSVAGDINGLNGDVPPMMVP